MNNEENEMSNILDQKLEENLFEIFSIIEEKLDSIGDTEKDIIIDRIYQFLNDYN